MTNPNLNDPCFLKALFVRTVLENKYIKSKPTIKQAQFLLPMCDELFFGGSAGPGKTEALLMSALQFVEYSDYNAILFRRTFSNLSLPGSLMDRAMEWLSPTDAKWNGEKKTWRFPSGATLTFGHMENEKDKWNYQSTDFQFIGFDELTEFTETQYTYMFSRLRKKTDSWIPLRVRSASNPIGEGYQWVKERFIVSNPHLYIKALLTDNPYLDKETYLKSLSHLDPITRQRLLEGDWTVRESGIFKREWFKIIDEKPVLTNLVRYWDMASTPEKPGVESSYTAGALMGRDEKGYYYILDIVRFKGDPVKVRTVIRQTALMDGQKVRICIEQEPGSSGVNVIDYYRREVLPGFRFEGIRPTGSKVDRAIPWANQAQAGNVYICRGNWNRDFFEEIEIYPGGSKDQVDAVSGAYEQLAKPHFLCA